MGELKKMHTWSLNNPHKRKTKAGMPRFINSWLESGRNEYAKTATMQSYRSVNTVYVEEGVPDDDWSNFAVER